MRVNLSERESGSGASADRVFFERPFLAERCFSSNIYEGLLLPSRRLYFNNVHLPHNKRIQSGAAEPHR